MPRASAASCASALRSAPIAAAAERSRPAASASMLRQSRGIRVRRHRPPAARRRRELAQHRLARGPASWRAPAPGQPRHERRSPRRRCAARPTASACRGPGRALPRRRAALRRRALTAAARESRRLVGRHGRAQFATVRAAASSSASRAAHSTGCRGVLGRDGQEDVERVVESLPGRPARCSRPAPGRVAQEQGAHRQSPTARPAGHGLRRSSPRRRWPARGDSRPDCRCPPTRRTWARAGCRPGCRTSCRDGRDNAPCAGWCGTLPRSGRPRRWCPPTRSHAPRPPRAGTVRCWSATCAARSPGCGVSWKLSGGNPWLSGGHERGEVLPGPPGDEAEGARVVGRRAAPPDRASRTADRTARWRAPQPRAAGRQRHRPAPRGGRTPPRRRRAR